MTTPIKLSGLKLCYNTETKEVIKQATPYEIHKNYIDAQFNKLDIDNDWKPKLKITSFAGETMWIDINHGQLQAIKDILTNNESFY